MNKYILWLLLLLPLAAGAQVQTYSYHPAVERSSLYSVSVAAAPQTVLSTDGPDFVCFGIKETAEVEVEYCAAVENVLVSPESVKYSVEGSTVRLSLSTYDRVLVQINGSKPLLVFANPLENRPKFGKKDIVRVYKAGNIYEEGIITPKTSETIYIEPGAVVRGTFNGTASNNVSVAGYGILDATVDPKNHGLLMRRSFGASVSGIVLLNSGRLSAVFAECRDLTIDNLKVIASGDGGSSQSGGILMYGTSDAKVKRSFAYAPDAAFVLEPANATYGWEGPVGNVLFENCIGCNSQSGNLLQFFSGPAPTSELAPALAPTPAPAPESAPTPAPASGPAAALTPASVQTPAPAPDSEHVPLLATSPGGNASTPE